MKKILISSLLLGSAISILPINFALNNRTQVIENESVDDIEIASNSLSDDIVYDNNIYGDNSIKYTTVFINNLTRPVISPNKDIPGFLGAWDTDTFGTFPSTIGWSTPSIFQSWSVHLKDHPSLKNTDVPANFSPGLVTALYSDNKYSSNKRNQIFAIVANTANLNAREYWMLRYNAIDGSPIKDDNSKMPKMSNAPIPQMTKENGNGSAFALANDNANDRYLAFYPGRLGDLKNDIFGFKLTSDNKIEWLENNKSFSGHKNWSNNISSTASIDYNNDNFVLGLAPFNNKIGDNGASLSLMISSISEEDNSKFNFRILDLKDDFSAIDGFTTKTLLGRSAGVFNSAQGKIQVPKNLMTLSTVQRNIIPHLQLFNFTDDSGKLTHKVQMIVPILNGSEWIFMYLSGISDADNNTYHNSWRANGSLSQGSFFSSHSFSVDDMPPVISYDDNNPNLIIVIAQADTKTRHRFSCDEFTFDTMPANGPWDPKSFLLAEGNEKNKGLNWKQKNILFRHPWGEDVLHWSFPSGQNNQFVSISDGKITTLQQLTTGGIRHENFQKSASRLNWLDGQSKAKFPTEVLDEDLLKIGANSKEHFFLRPTVTYPEGSTNSFHLEMHGQPLRDNSRGVIEGVFNFTQNYTMNGIKYFDYKSKIPFRITGLKIGETPTSINQNNSISQILPSELTPENASNFIDIIGLPKDHGEVEISNWEITNQNNANGTATISAKIHPYYDENGLIVTDPNKPKRFSTNVSGLKQVSGTTIVKKQVDTSNLTVWDVNDKNAENFVQINDLIPGSSNNDIKYLIKDQSPLTGELTIVVSISAGSYYDPSNKGLPSIIGGKPLEVPINITGFKMIPNTGTLVTPRNGEYPGIFPAFIKKDNAADFFDISNAVPNSTYILENFDYDEGDVSIPFSGKVSFDLKFDREYKKDGTIDENPNKRSIIIEGFQPGIGPNETLALSTSNKDLFSNTLAPEINDDNIEKYITLVNLPDDTRISYEFGNQKNTDKSTNNIGYQDVKVTVSKYFDTSGSIVNEAKTFDVRIDGLKTIGEPTYVEALNGSRNTLPQFFNEVVDVSKYYKINFASPIPDKPSSIEIDYDSFVKNNIAGTITFRYQLINAIDHFGFIEKSEYKTITIRDFQQGVPTRIEQSGNFKDKKASEFELNPNDLNNYFKFNGYFIIPTEEEGEEVEGTSVVRIEKLSFDDTIGSATFKATIVGGAINQEGIFTIDELDITFKIDGFEIVTPPDNTTPIIIGAVSGGIALVILIIVAIVIFNNKKNKKILNEKRKPTPTNSAPPTPPVMAGPTPTNGTPPVMAGPTPTNGTPPINQGSGRPMPPPRR